ncbi:MAG: hypothetical protein HOP29_03020 [Phycisphaerales bacterium]|nr:hypothetical protein [Phycisphaerales bacterium]
MSPVTKVLIVVLVVFCIAFSMVAISLTAQTSDWKALAEEFQQAAQIADASQRSLMASHAAELASARDNINDLLGRLGKLETDLQSSQEENARQGNEIAQLMTDNRRADALAQRLTNELGIAQNGRNAVEEQRRQLEARNIDLESRNIALNDRVNELTTQVTILDQQRRQQEQQINILRTENEKLALQSGVPGVGPEVTATTVPGVSPITPVPAPRITGEVQAVEGEYVTLTVGSNDQVTKGMVFVVSRGADTYVGDVEITDVEPDLSAGRLIRNAQGRLPQQGDVVRDVYQLLSPR